MSCHPERYLKLFTSTFNIITVCLVYEVLEMSNQLPTYLTNCGTLDLLISNLLTDQVQSEYNFQVKD